LPAIMETSYDRHPLLMRSIQIFCFFIFYSCTSHPDNKENSKRYDYRIAVTTSSFSGHFQKYIVNNLGIEPYEASDATILDLRPNTLYCISANKSKQKDTSRIDFSNNNCDTLFELTNQFFKNLSFSQYDTLTQPILDDVHAFVELSFNGRKLTATVSSFNNKHISTRQLDTLLNFLDKFKPTN
jgi:hypothetical protein